MREAGGRQRICPGSAQEKSLLSRAFVLAALLVAADQAVKIIAAKCIAEHAVIPVFPGFNLTHLNNPGAAWGMFAGRGVILLCISLAVLCAIVFFMRAFAEGWSERYYALFSHNVRHSGKFHRQDLEGKSR